MSSHEKNLWLWTDVDSRWKSKVFQYIKKNIPSNKDIILLHCTKLENFDQSTPLTNFVFNLCYKFNVFKGEKLMFLNTKDLLQAIELCRRKSNTGTKEDSNISDSDIICDHQNYVSHFDNEENSSKSVVELSAFVKQNNCIDLFSILDILNEFKKENAEFLSFLSDCKFLILGQPSSNVLIKLIQLLSTANEVSNIYVATPLNISLQGSPTSPLDSIEISALSLLIEEIPFHVDTEVNVGSATEEYVLDIILSFLSLLVNSRNELSLSKVMISPFIDLTHEAFTKLKHLAAEKDMPMCQTAVSYVTRVRLGGKGYAPQSDCPMMSHLKSLELFVDTLNQLQTLMEEETKPTTALKRLVNILKKKLLKCGSEKLKPSAIESACEQLKTTADEVANLAKTQMYTSNSPQVNQENFDLLRFFVNYIHCDFNTFDPEQILLRKKVKRTPINLPPLLGYFRSPDEESTCDSLPIADEDSVISTTSSIKVAVAPVSYFHHSDNSSMSHSCVEYSSPVKISFEGCLGDDVNMENKKKQIETPKHPKKKSKGLKRSILGEITNENSNSNSRNKKLKVLNFKSDDITDENSNSENKKLKILDVLDKVSNENSNSENRDIILNSKSNVNSKMASKNQAKSKKEPKRKDVKKEAKSKAKASKGFKQIEGQGKITNFFTMK